MLLPLICFEAVRGRPSNDPLPDALIEIVWSGCLICCFFLLLKTLRVARGESGVAAGTLEVGTYVLLCIYALGLLLFVLGLPGMPLQ